MIDKEKELKNYYEVLEEKINVLSDILHKTNRESVDEMERTLWFTEGYLKATLVAIGEKIEEIS